MSPIPPNASDELRLAWMSVGNREPGSIVHLAHPLFDALAEWLDGQRVTDIAYELEPWPHRRGTHTILLGLKRGSVTVLPWPENHAWQRKKANACPRP